MTASDFHLFMLIQKEKIEKYKWVESEKAGRDLGQQAVVDWIRKYAKKYAEEWNNEHINNSGNCSN